MRVGILTAAVVVVAGCRPGSPMPENSGPYAVGPGQVQQPMLALPGTPELIEPPDFAIEPAASLRLTFRVMGIAATSGSYYVQWNSDQPPSASPEGEHLVSDFSDGGAIGSYSFDSLSVGTYFWRVVYKDSLSQSVLLASPWQSFSVDTTISQRAWGQLSPAQLQAGTQSTTIMSAEGITLEAGTASGTYVSPPIAFANGPAGALHWGQVSWNAVIPASTVTPASVTVQVYYFDDVNLTYKLIPDTALSGNSNGFRSSPVALPLDPVYSSIQLFATLTEASDGGLPTLTMWRTSWEGEFCAGQSDGTACKTADACAHAQCISGQCTVAAYTQCPQAYPCLVQACDPGSGQCVAVNTNGTSCDDGSLCTTKDTCSASECVGTPVSCPVNTNPCRQDGVCDAMTGGCVYAKVADGNTCDDGQFCTVNDACLSGVCSGEPKVCPASNACVIGVCDEVGDACTTGYADPGTMCPDTDPCNGLETCDGSGTCQAAAGPSNCAPAYTVAIAGPNTAAAGEWTLVTVRALDSALNPTVAAADVCVSVSGSRGGAPAMLLATSSVPPGVNTLGETTVCSSTDAYTGELSLWVSDRKAEEVTLRALTSGLGGSSNPDAAHVIAIGAAAAAGLQLSTSGDAQVCGEQRIFIDAFDAFGNPVGDFVDSGVAVNLQVAASTGEVNIVSTTLASPSSLPAAEVAGNLTSDAEIGIRASAAGDVSVTWSAASLAQSPGTPLVVHFGAGALDLQTSSLSVDPGPPARVKLEALDACGRPIVDLQPSINVSAGTVGEFVSTGPGVWVATIATDPLLCDAQSRVEVDAAGQSLATTYTVACGGAPEPQVEGGCAAVGAGPFGALLALLAFRRRRRN